MYLHNNMICNAAHAWSSRAAETGISRKQQKKPATCKHGWSKHGSSIICYIQTWTI